MLNSANDFAMLYGGSSIVLGKAGLSPAQLFALRKTTLTRVKAGRTAGTASNPVDNADYPSPPTLVQSATHNAALTVRATHLANPTLFQLSGGRVYDRTTTSELFVASESVLPSSGGNLNAYTSLSPALASAGEFQGYYAVAEMVTGQIVEVQVRTALASTPYRLIVDGQYVNRDGFVADTSAKNYNSWDFGSTATRRVTVEVQTANAFIGISTNAGGSIVSPNDALQIIAGFSGDSIMESTSGGDATFSVWDGIPVTFSKKWGISSPWLAAVGTTGWVNPGSGGRTNILGQLSQWINSAKFDLLVFFAGINDTASNLAAIQAAMLPALQLARAAQPQALIIVGGVWGQATGPSASVLLTEANIKTVFQLWSDPFSIYMPNSNDPLGSWLTGTGFVGSTNGTGNSDIYVSSDGLHPSRAGRLYGGGKISTALDTAILPFYAAYGVGDLELREDGSTELREDGSKELRE